MLIYYFDENGNFTGNGESNVIVPGSTDKKPLPGQKWDGFKWIDPQPLSLTEISKLKSNEINMKAQQFIDKEIEQYPEFEKLTFDRQEREAHSYIADNTVSTPTLTRIATARGLTVLEIADRVIAKANAFAGLAAEIAGQRQAYHDQLATAVQAQDSTAIEDIIVSYALPV